ncbi:MAG TPA: alpha/beta hydrolase [Candidatus Thermoplasmatota archaeon]|nr:alpha/beta hydrolase [Candidatus Thermoplasmatota archaeon]
MPSDLGFTHVYEPAANPRTARTLLLLHGTGGDENDLIPLGRALAPDANLLSPRGKVLENGMPRFFRRFAEGVLDVEDLKTRAGELAGFVAAAAEKYGFDPANVTALGYSNGANVAVGMLLERPRVLAGAVLVRAMVPYEPEAPPSEPARARVLVLAGRYDPYSRSPQGERLQQILQRAGAAVDLRYAEAGHEISPSDVSAARAWLSAALEARQ